MASQNEEVQKKCKKRFKVVSCPEIKKYPRNATDES